MSKRRRVYSPIYKPEEQAPEPLLPTSDRPSPNQLEQKDLDEILSRDAAKFLEENRQKDGQ